MVGEIYHSLFFRFKRVFLDGHISRHLRKLRDGYIFTGFMSVGGKLQVMKL